jgi:glycosyltransferase involved in cell wall biosynthesis
MGGHVAYISDQKWFQSAGHWYTTASFPLDFIADRLEVSSWTFWGRLYDDVEDADRLFRLAAPAGLEERIFFEGPRNQATGPAGYAGAVRLSPYLRRVVLEADVVWLKLPYVFTLLAYPFCRRGQVVVSQQVGDARASLALKYPRYGLLGGVMAHCCRRIATYADVTSFVSSQLAEQYGGARRDLLIANESRVTEAMILHAPRECSVPPLEIVFVGRLAPEKCVHDLIQALAQVPDARLTVVGDGPERSRLEELSLALGAHSRITWRGYVPWGPGLFEMLSQASVLALPSATEGLPLVAVEAMSQGLPVVATRVGGIPEIVEDGVSGLLVDAHRPDQLARALRLLSSDPALRRNMAFAALKTARRHTLERQTGPLLDRIRQVRAHAAAR